MCFKGAALQSKTLSRCINVTECVCDEFVVCRTSHRFVETCIMLLFCVVGHISSYLNIYVGDKNVQTFFLTTVVCN